MSHAFILHQFKINLNLIACFAVIVQIHTSIVPFCDAFRFISNGTRLHRRQTLLGFLIRPCRVPNERHLYAGSDKKICRLGYTISRLATRQRSSAHKCKSFLSQSACVCTWQRVAKEGGCASPASQTPSPPPFVFMSAFHFPLFSFLFFTRDIFVSALSPSSSLPVLRTRTNVHRVKKL